MREDRTEWFTARDPFLPVISQLLDLGVFLPLKEKSENRLVVVIRTGCHDPKLYSQNNVLKVSKMILDYVLAHDESISFHGVVAIFDMKGVTAGHAFQITPAIMKRYSKIKNLKLYVFISIIITDLWKAGKTIRARPKSLNS